MVVTSCDAVVVVVFVVAVAVVVAIAIAFLHGWLQFRYASL